jgi:hypothetical protein
MALTKKQLAAREGKVTASFVPALMAGNKEKIMSEWRMLVGDPTHVPEDLSFSWPVQFGSFIEPFALDWYSRKNRVRLSRRGEVVNHPDLSHVCCTLDAYDDERHNVIDCKAPGQWRKLDEVIQYYTPQMIVQRQCVVGALQASLLIVHGGSEPQEYPVDIDPEYEKTVWERIAQFWKCVEDMTPPFDIEPSLAPVVPVKTYDMSTDNYWCNEAGIWLENRNAAKIYESAAKNIKALVPADGIIAKGGGITVSRNKAGSLSIKEESK